MQGIWLKQVISDFNLGQVTVEDNEIAEVSVSYRRIVPFQTNVVNIMPWIFEVKKWIAISKVKSLHLSVYEYPH